MGAPEGDLRRLYRTRDALICICMRGLLEARRNRGPMLVCMACMLMSKPASV